ncbi:MAG TPA: MiaB/RimO family radical SAM methylthiotransferase [Tepidisphaeraceae bacterium]|jgi:threonylcarbamoyladenosine tRNA methylthiotransferase MtaB
MRTFCIQTLGCKVNQYESEQIATLLRQRGMVESNATAADLRIVNTCSVTSESASKSRQMIRRAVRLNVLVSQPPASVDLEDFGQEKKGSRVIAMGCWATSNREEAAKMAGVDAVVTHGDDVAKEFSRLLDKWSERESQRFPAVVDRRLLGTVGLPLLDSRHKGHQRAFLKIQDGCDAHCTYCIIPKLRPTVWSKPIEDVIEEARQLVAAGHRELVLTGIFLSAYGQSTALRRRQTGGESKLGELLERLCESVPGLEGLRLSSLEPGDLTPGLLWRLRSLPQVMPHFHLPLQSGSERILRRMNRQYGRDDFLRMVDQIYQAYDRVALTTDIIAGFPGETEEDFADTLAVVERAKFIHVHAFSFSARPGTAAARWEEDFVSPGVSAERVRVLQKRASLHSLEFRTRFVGRKVRVHVEESSDGDVQHGRTGWYFPVYFWSEEKLSGKLMDVMIERVDAERSWGILKSSNTDSNKVTRG